MSTLNLERLSSVVEKNNGTFDVRYSSDVNFIAEKDTYNAIQKLLNSSLTTDVVEFDSMSEFTNFATYWCDDKMFNKHFVPADIVKEGTVPIKDIKIKWSLNYSDDLQTTVGTDVDPNCRGEYTLRIIAIDEDDNFPDPDNMIKLILSLRCSLPKLGIMEIATPVVSFYEGELKTYCLYSTTQFAHPTLNLTAFSKLFKMSGNLLLRLSDVAHLGLKCWYGIQLALMHPVIKDVFVNPSSEKRDRKELLEYKGPVKKKSKYFKKHIINSDNCIDKSIDNKLDEINNSPVTDGKRKYTRRKLLWRVVGHYRKKRNSDETIWISPFWKGIMRDSPNKEILLENEREVLLNNNIKNELK